MASQAFFWQLGVVLVLMLLLIIKLVHMCHKAGRLRDARERARAVSRSSRGAHNTDVYLIDNDFVVLEEVRSEEIGETEVQFGRYSPPPLYDPPPDYNMAVVMGGSSLKATTRL